MPRKPCYWTRKLELDLVDFVRRREFIWKPVGNTNHHIQQKYKAYAEFAAQLGRGFTARSVRDRWVNIRSTFNHNLRRVSKSKETARSPADVYIPCWPLWKPLQFLKDVSRKEDIANFEDPTLPSDFKELQNIEVKEELLSELDDIELLGIRQRGQRTDRPRKKSKTRHPKVKYNDKCKKVIDELVQTMRPLIDGVFSHEKQCYWSFGRHVTERLNSMRPQDAQSAGNEIMNLINELP